MLTHQISDALVDDLFWIYSNIISSNTAGSSNNVVTPAPEFGILTSSGALLVTTDQLLLVTTDAQN